MMSVRCKVAFVLFAVFGVCIAHTAHAQLRGRITDRSHGIEFVVPDGWFGSQTDRGYTFQPGDNSGMLLLVVYHNAASRDSLRIDLEDGISWDANVEFSIEGEILPYTKDGYTMEYIGAVQYQPAEAYGIALQSPFGGGITVLVAGLQGQHAGTMKHIAESLVQSVVFILKDTPQSE